MKYFMIGIGVLCVSILFPPSAYAHTLITDQTGNKGAIFHITPDDDPIAGEKVSLFFDTQSKLLTKTTSVTLEIQQNNGTFKKIATTVDDSLVTARYIFPSQGIYTIRYTVTPATSTPYIFNETIRVARGTAPSSVNTTRYDWAEGILIGCGATLLCLLILIWNYRKDIAQQSTF